MLRESKINVKRCRCSHQKNDHLGGGHGGECSIVECDCTRFEESRALFLKETYPKNMFLLGKCTKDDKTLENAVMKILYNAESSGLTQPEIQKIIVEKPYRTKITRMGLWKVLNRLEKQGEIEKKITKKGIIYTITKKSKIVAEIQGITFRTDFKRHLLANEEKLQKEFKNADHKKNSIDSLIQFFGFYVLGSILASYSVNEKQRSQWLKSVLDLESGKSLSEYFEQLTNNDEKVIESMALFLKETYPKNMFLLGKCTKDGTEM